MITRSTDRMTRRPLSRLVLAAGLSAALPLSALATASLNDALVLYDFGTLNDSNGGNSALTIVDAGDNTLIGVGVAGGGFWNDEGPGSDDVYANLRSGDSRVGTYMDAAQGAGNELQITGAHTILWRGEFKNVSITGYLWNKYDHNIGPNSLKNRGAFTRYEPGGILTYSIDDGDATAGNGINVILPGGTVTTGGNKYEIISVFDPANNLASLYVLNPKTRAVLSTNSAAVTYDTLDMATPVPFTLGDRLAWSGSWQSIGGSGGKVDVEMFAVWDQAFSESELVNLVIPEPATALLLGAGLLAFVLRRR